MASDFDRFVEELEQRVIAQARAVYSDEDPAADHGSGDTEDGACLRYQIAGELECFDGGRICRFTSIGVKCAVRRSRCSCVHPPGRPSLSVPSAGAKR